MTNMFGDAVEKVEHQLKNPYVEAAVAATATLAAVGAALYLTKGESAISVAGEVGTKSAAPVAEDLLAEVRAAGAQVPVKGGLSAGAKDGLLLLDPTKKAAGPLAEGALKELGMAHVPPSGLTDLRLPDTVVQTHLPRGPLEIHIPKELLEKPGLAVGERITAHGLPISAEARAAALNPDVLRMPPWQRAGAIRELSFDPAVLKTPAWLLNDPGMDAVLVTTKTVTTPTWLNVGIGTGILALAAAKTAK